MTPSKLIQSIISAPRTDKIIKIVLRVFRRGKNVLQNGVLHFVFIRPIVEKRVGKL